MGQSIALLKIETTFKNEDEAFAMLRALLEARLVACGHIHAFRGGYWWDGEIQDGREALLILKTVPQLRDAVFSHIKAHHPYEVPMIVAHDIRESDVDAAYLAWAVEETRRS